jgi:anti-sigma factor ChrR (cupin superfamily)
MSIDPMTELLPSIFSGMPGETFSEQDLDFQPLTRDGRVGVEMHPLYTTADTGENGPAAAILRYQPGSTAATHLHPGYELIYVFSGELETDDGVYPANSMLVLPPGSVHAPRSPKGAVFLVVWEQPVRTV